MAGLGDPYQDPRVGAQSAAWGGYGLAPPEGTGLTGYPAGLLVAAPNTFPANASYASLIGIGPPAGTDYAAARGVLGGRGSGFSRLAVPGGPPAAMAAPGTGAAVAARSSALTASGVGGYNPYTATPGAPEPLNPVGTTAGTYTAPGAEAAASATPWGAYGIAGGLALAGTTLGYLGARKAAGAAEAQRQQVNQQAAAARSQITKDVERFRDVSQSQAARAGAAHGLLDSGLTARSQATKAQYAEEILTSKLSDIQQRRMQMIAEIPTDDEIWAGFYGQLAGTAFSLGGLAVGSALGNPMAGAMVGNVLGQYAQQQMT